MKKEEIIELVKFLIIPQSTLSNEEIEQRATFIYDTFHKGHVKKEKVTGLIAPNPEVAKEICKLLKIEDKKKLSYRLEALRRVLEEIEEEEEKEKEAAKLTKNIK